MKTKITTLFILTFCTMNLFSSSFTVSNNGDSGTGSLRQAITDANADVNTPHTITFNSNYTITLSTALPAIAKSMTIDGGVNTIEINSSSSGTTMLIVNASTPLSLKNLTLKNAIISASGTLTAIGCTFKNANPTAVKVSGITFTATNCIFDSNTGGSGPGSAITTIAAGSVVSLTSCKITNNSSSGGAAVYVQGNNISSKLEMINCIVSGNTNSSSSAFGGGVASAAATTTITNCQISGNTASRGGGLALLVGGTTASSSLTMTGSTVSGNSLGLYVASAYGGGVYIQGTTANYTGNCSFTNCTISGNTTPVLSTPVTTSTGGGVQIGGGSNSSWTPTITFTNCTITGNTLQGNTIGNSLDGAGIHKSNGTVVLNYCIVAGNNSNSSSVSRDLASVTSSTGRNLYGGTPNWNSTTTTGNVNLTADISTILNTTLADNGGTTALPDGSYVKTHALMAGTSVQTAIDPDATGVSGLPSTDQRGNGRDALPDMGAYESMFPGVPTAVTVASNNVSGQLSVSFTSPSVSSKGGASISNYKYSIDGGTSFTALSTPQTTSPFVISGLTNGTTYNVQIKAVNSNGDGVSCASKTGTPNVATITGAATATAFTTTYGTASSPQSFSISGANLAGAITATAPTGFEVSSDGTNYGTTSTYSRSLVDFTASGTVYIRLKASATVIGTYNSKNIILTSSGATSVNITTSASGNAVSAKALTISTPAATSKQYDGNSTAVITGSLSGIVSGDESNVILNGTGTFASTGVGIGIFVTSTSTLGGTKASNYSLTQPTGLTADITAITSTLSGNLGTQALLTGTDVTVVANTELTVDNSVNVHSITVAPQGKLTINDTKSLAVGNLTLQSSPSGTATFTDANASGGFTVTGTATVQQYFASARNWYISSPISNATAPNGYTYYKYHEAGDNVGYTAPATAYWENIGATPTLAAGVGYIANLASGTATYSLSGTLNTGTVPLPTLSRSGAVKPGFNLVGNPYPSFLDITSLQNNANLEPSYWVRSYNSIYVFDTYNIPGGVSTGNSGLTVSSLIAPMQAFWLRVKNGQSSASVSFSNSMRAHQDVSNNKFRVRESSALTQPLIRLQVSNGTNSDEAVLYSNPNASNDFDIYDSQKMSNGSSSIPEIYTMASTENLAINGLNSIPNDTEIALGFTTATAGSFSIKASQISNFNAGTQVILKDYQNPSSPIIADLSDGSSYSFSSDFTSNNTSRFTLIFHAPSVTTGINPTGQANDAWISVSGGKIAVNGNLSSDASMDVFNALGQKIQSKNLNAIQTQKGTTLPAGVYVISLTNGGKTSTKRILVD